MTYLIDPAYCRDLEADADRPEVQELIRREILRGTIRVRPRSGGGILIMPVRRPEGPEPGEVGPPPGPLAARTRRSGGVVVG
jgi:hypothetical protein